jgi:hypothetical protein
MTLRTFLESELNRLIDEVDGYRSDDEEQEDAAIEAASYLNDAQDALLDVRCRALRKRANPFIDESDHRG